MALLDMFGAEVAAGDFVVGAYDIMGSGIGVFEVTRTTDKMLKLRNINAKKEMKNLRYSANVVKITDLQYKALVFEAIRNSK